MGIQVTLPSTYEEASPRDIKNKKEFDRSGVYVFYDKHGTPLYVGKTVSFKRRFSDHSGRSDFFNLATKARLYTVKSEYEKDVYETYLINELKPEYNRAKTFYTRMEYEEMLHKIQEKIADIMCELDEIRQSLSDINGDFDEEDDSELLGESLLLERQIAELESQLRKLHGRKGNILARLSA